MNLIQTLIKKVKGILDKGETIETYILIPTYDNDGKEFSLMEYEKMEKILLDNFGGYSKEPGLVEGSWINEEGEIFKDKNRKYVIAINTKDKAKIKEICGLFRDQFRQEAIFLNINGKIYFI